MSTSARQHITKAVVWSIQFAIGVTFVVSGLSKCIDPAGTAIKFAEYLQYFGMYALVDYTMPMSWVLCLLEYYCGYSLLVGRRAYSALWLSALMMLVFTPLTLWLALTNAIDDCGCFGDLIHLSNSATFAKNLVIDVLLILLFVFRNTMYEFTWHTLFKLFKRCNLILVIFLCWIGTSHEPFVDFRPYTPGTDLGAQVFGATTADSVWYTCIYSLDGRRQEFNLESLPNEDEGWEFVDYVEHHSAESGDNRASLDFFIKDEAGDIQTDLIGAPGYTIVLLSASLDDASQHDIDRIEMISEFADDHKYAFFCLTARDLPRMEQWRYNTGAEYPIYFTDVTVVQTICRSNPCVMLLHDGVICWKKTLADLDTEAFTSVKLDEQIFGEIEENSPNRRFSALLILLFAPIALYLLVKLLQLVFITLTKKDSKDA